jgi:hypothetical protein
MAANTSPQVVWKDGISDRVAVFVLVGVTTGDTVDLSAFFSKIEKAFFIPKTGNANPAPASIAGSVLTLTAVNLANDAIVLTVSGAASV